MARLDIAKIKRLDKERNTIHEKEYTTYSTFDVDGRHYVQIDTYGRGDREQPGKISQSIQLDEKSALALGVTLRQSCPCQKHPSTNITILFFGNTKSGFPIKG